MLRSIKNIEVRYIQINDNSKDYCLSINYNDKQLGCIYSITEANLKLFSSKHVIYILDINLDEVNRIEKNEIKYEPIPKYPETYLDFSILTPIDMLYCYIENIINKFTNELVIKTKYMDTYLGENVPKGMKSTTIRIVIGDSNRTLQIEEINKVKEFFME